MCHVHWNKTAKSLIQFLLLLLISTLRFLLVLLLLSLRLNMVKPCCWLPALLFLGGVKLPEGSSHQPASEHSNNAFMPLLRLRKWCWWVTPVGGASAWWWLDWSVSRWWRPRRPLECAGSLESCDAGYSICQFLFIRLNKDRGNELTRHSTSCRLLVFQIGSVLRFAQGLTRHKEFQTRAGTMLSIFSSSWSNFNWIWFSNSLEIQLGVVTVLVLSSCPYTVWVNSPPISSEITGCLFVCFLFFTTCMYTTSLPLPYFQGTILCTNTFILVLLHLIKLKITSVQVVA